MDPEVSSKIETIVLEILNTSDLDATSLFQVRESASEKLGMDLSQPDLKIFVRNVVNTYCEQQQLKAEVIQNKEYDDQGNLVICRLSKKRKVTITKFKGRDLVSIREYYNKGGKELPSIKGISLTAEQWSKISKNVPAIERAIENLAGRKNKTEPEAKDGSDTEDDEEEDEDAAVEPEDDAGDKDFSGEEEEEDDEEGDADENPAANDNDDDGKDDEEEEEEEDDDEEEQPPAKKRK